MERRARALNNLRNLPGLGRTTQTGSPRPLRCLRLSGRARVHRNTKNRLQPNRRLRDVTLATIAVMLTTALVQWSWKALFEEMIFSALAWAASTWAPSVYTLTNRIFLFFQEEGLDMFNNHLALIITVIGLLSLLGLRSIWPKSRAIPTVLLTLSIGVTMTALPSAGQALQIIQQEDPVIVAASQSIDDTLLITSKDATVHGDIKGSLFIAAEDVEVTGDISGNLITLADNVTISGSIGGTIISLGDSIVFEDAKVAGDLWLAGDTVKFGFEERDSGQPRQFRQFDCRGGQGRQGHACGRRTRRFIR